MNTIRFKKKISCRCIKIFLIAGMLFLVPPLLLAQRRILKPNHQDDLIVRVDNIVLHGELTVRALTANFPYPILSTISVCDSQANLIMGLADTLRWLGPEETAENGMLISEIWEPLLEYHEADPSIPPDPDLYHQVPKPLVTEIRKTAPLPTCTMLVMDVSESMVEEIAQAKEGLRLYIRLFRPQDRGGIVQFSSQVVDFQPMTNDTSLLIQKINDARVGGGTAIYDALMKAIDGIKCDRGRRSIIVYTDGEDRSSKVTPQAVIDSARVYNLPIYTIALGNMTQEMVLKQIAEQTNAMFFKAVTADEMKIIYGNLSRLMQNYYVMAHASPDPNFNHSWRLVDLTVKTPERQGRGTGRYFVGGPPATLTTDLELNLASRTDTFVVDYGDTVNAVLPGDTFEYLLTVKNLGPNLADTVKLIHHLPDSVQYLNASLPPTFSNKDSLTWDLINIMPEQEVNVSVIVNLSALITTQVTELHSSARIFAEHDSSEQNNRAVDTTKVLFKTYDLSLSQVALTDTTIELGTETFPAEFAGDSYRYSLLIINSGPATAKDFWLRDIVPDSVSLTDFNILPVMQKSDTLFWQFDILSAGDSIRITFFCTVKDSLPFYPFPLINSCDLIAKDDIFNQNNHVTTTIYALEKRKPTPTFTDLSLEFVSLTDTFLVLNHIKNNAVLPGDPYQYLISVTNQGSQPADCVRLVQILPDSVSFLLATVTPQIISKDSLIWHFGTIQPNNEISISLSVRLAQNIPKTWDRLVSQALVFAVNDTTAFNNSLHDTVLIIFPEKPPLLEPYNVTMKHLVDTDTTIILMNEIVPAVFQGETYRYRLTITNFGPGIARDLIAWDALPDSVTIVSSSVVPIKQITDSLFWRWDSLAVNDSIGIALDVAVSQSLPYTPFPLMNTSGIFVERDTVANDNLFSSLIYAITRPEEPQPKYTDISIRQLSVTDSFVVVGDDTLKFARQGETYDYVITVHNEGAINAQNITIVDLLPDAITASNFEPQPKVISKDSLVWDIGALAAQSAFNLRFAATLPERMPGGKNLLINTVFTNAANEDPGKLHNNMTIDTVYNLVPPIADWKPMIEATPAVVEVGNEVSLRVQVTAPIASWDLWVYFADHHIDSTYADEFIASYVLEPGLWHDVEPKFFVTRKTTQDEQEPLLFELRCIDISGALKTAQANVTIFSVNDFDIDRNIFIPDQEDPLTINVKLKSDQMAKIEIYDITGTRITRVTESQFKAGWSTLQWNGRTENGQKIGTGFYIITINSDGLQAWKKLMIIR